MAAKAWKDAWVAALCGTVAWLISAGVNLVAKPGLGRLQRLGRIARLRSNRTAKELSELPFYNSIWLEPAQGTSAKIVIAVSVVAAMNRPSGEKFAELTL